MRAFFFLARLMTPDPYYILIWTGVHDITTACVEVDFASLKVNLKLGPKSIMGAGLVPSSNDWAILIS